jgi:hypothetical protein
LPANIIENVIFSIGSLSELLGVADFNLRRAVDRLVKAGQLSGQRLRGWRWFRPEEVPAIVQQLQADGHLSADYKLPDLTVQDLAGEVLTRAGARHTIPRKEEK